MQRLEDLGSIASELMHVDWFVDHVDNPDYECAIEALNATPGVSLETSYSRILCKVADVAKPEPRDQNALTQRELRIQLPDNPAPSPSSCDNINLDKCKQDNGMMCLPLEMFESLPREIRKKTRDLNGAVRRARRKRKENNPLPTPPDVPQMHPRSNNVQNKKQKAVASDGTKQ